MSNVAMNISNSRIYAFIKRNSKKYLYGTGLTEFALLNGFVYAKLDSKRSRCIPIICEYLKANNYVTCSDEVLAKLVSKVYTNINNFEREDFIEDYEDLSPLFRPWFVGHFRNRMLE